MREQTSSLEDKLAWVRACLGKGATGWGASGIQESGEED